MKEIIEVKKDRTGKETVNARELHEFLDSKQEFSTWIKRRIKKFGFLDNIDFVTIDKKVGRQKMNEYHISVEMAKELSMVENNDKGKEARRYFIDIEKVAKQHVQNAHVDYEAIGKMIGMAVTAALTPVVDRLDKLSNQRALPEPVKEDRYSLVAFCKRTGVQVNRSELAMHGMALKKLASSKNITLNKIPDERWGFVNSYPVEILEEYFSA
jgi:anti-repressor protein